MDIVEMLEYDIPVLGITVSQVLTALLILIFGLVVIKIVVLIFKKSLIKAKMPKLMADFLGKFVSAILYVVLLVFVMGGLGVQVGSIFLGLSAALGLIIAFGMQDTLNNMFAGIWISTLRPIKMDEVVEVNGVKGKVVGLSVMSTELLTPDNTYITIPNREVWGSPIKNDTRMPTRRVDVDVGVAYGTKLDDAIRYAMDFMKANRSILSEPAPDVVVTSLDDSAIVLQLRAWTKTENYWPLKGYLTREIPKVYGSKGVEIPFPQLDVHMDK